LKHELNNAGLSGVSAGTLILPDFNLIAGLASIDQISIISIRTNT
jgi:hypothetical protein